MARCVREGIVRDNSCVALARDAEPEVTRWESDRNRDVLEVYHTGYQRLKNPVTHRRRFTFEKEEKSWLIEDSLEGSGKHEVQASLHFDSEVSLHVDGVGEFIASGRESGRSMRLTIRSTYVALTNEDFDIEEDWVSRQYGSKRKGLLLKVTFMAQFPAELKTCILPADESLRSVV